jgi:hypothetical protein
MGTYYAVQGGSRILNASRVDQSGSDNADVTNWAKADAFILAVNINSDGKDTVAAQYKLRWRVSGGTFADVASTGAIKFGSTDLTNGATIAVGGRKCSSVGGDTWQTGYEVEGTALSTSINLADEYETEVHFSLSCADATSGALYEFELYDATAGASRNTCGATLTIMPDPAVTTNTCASVTYNSADGSGNITSTGGYTVTRRGFCYKSGTSGDPTTSDSTVYDDGSYGTGTYSKALTGLSAEGSYRVRAYIVANSTTYYGSTVQLTLTDIPPTVALNTPADTATGVSVTPALVFTGTDAGGDEIDYEVQVDTANTFDSQAGITVVDSYTGSAPSVSQMWLSGYTRNGQSFTSVVGEYLSACVFKLSKYGTPTGTLTAVLYAHTGTYGDGSTGKATGSVLATSTNSLDVSTLDGTPTDKTFNFDGTYQLNDQYYVILLQLTGGTSDSGNYAQIQINTTASSHSGNLVNYISPNWYAAAYDAYFIVNCTEIGKPLLDTLSSTDDHANWSGTGDPHPWPSGNQVTYTVPGGSALTAGVQHYWRVRGKDPSGSNTWGSWATTRSFTTTGGGTNVTVNVSAPESFASSTLTPTVTTTREATVSATIQSFVSATLAPVISAVRNVTTTVAILSAAFTTLTPTVTAETSVSNSPPIESATFETFTPTVTTTRNPSVTSTILSGVLETIQPSLTLNDNEEIAAGLNSGVFATLTPTISTTKSVSTEASLQSFASATLDPTIATTRNVSSTPAIESGTFATLAPTISPVRNVSTSPSIETGTFAQLDPEVTGSTGSVSIAIDAALQYAQFETLAPSITVATNTSTSATIQSGAFATLDLTISITRNVSSVADIQSAVFATIQPSITYNDNEDIAPGIQSGTFATLDPAISTTRNPSVSPAIQSGAFETIQPTITTGGDMQVFPDIQSAQFLQPQTTASATRNIDVSADIQSAIFETIQPSLTLNDNEEISVSISSAQFETIDPTVTTTRSVSTTPQIQTGTFQTLNPTITVQVPINVTVQAPVQYIGAIKNIFIINRGKPAIYLGGNNYLEL